jgi:D-inositol-3-phosphate glycosyltransferase
MRITIVGPAHPYKGGIAQHTNALAHRLAGAGHDVTIESWSEQYPARLYPGQQKLAAPEGEPFEPTWHPLSWRRPDGWLRLGYRLAGRADAVVLVVVTPIQAPAYLGILAGLRAGRARKGGGTAGAPPVLALCHNVLPHERRPFDVPLTRAVLRGATGVLVHTDAEAALARTLTSRPVRVAPLAPHFTEPRPTEPGASEPGASEPGGAESSPAAGRVEAAEPSEPAEPSGRLLFFGLVRPYKGLDIALHALAAGPAGVSLTVAGEFWGGVEATRALVAELGLDDRVDLRPGYVNAADVPKLFAAADALVLPYLSGTASQNADLAFRHGLPVIATTVGTLGQSVRDGVDGFLVAPGDVTALADALRRLYAPGRWRALRAAVRPPDPAAAWDRYVDAVVGTLCGGRTTLR